MVVGAGTTGAGAVVLGSGATRRIPAAQKNRQSSITTMVDNTTPARTEHQKTCRSVTMSINISYTVL